MPVLKIDHIISFSSEDSLHVANNILSRDSTKKWKCKRPGEKNAVIVLQLEKACTITGIDIGNEHSAYIEVHVSRSENKDEYKVLLTMCSFMAPLESRQSQNVNKVRMFNKNELSHPECDEKWDRVKIVCTQPFNKHVQYGLNFVNFHTSSSKINATSAHSTIGKFTIRPESPDNLSLGSIFSKQKDSNQEKLTGAAAIRDAASASSLALHGSPMCKPKLKIQTTPGSSDANTFHDVSRKERQIEESITKGRIERNKNELFYSKDELDSSNDLNKQPENINHNLEKKTDKKPWEERPNQKVRSPITANKNQSLNVPVNNTSKPRTPKRKNDDSFREKLKRKKMEDEKKKPFSRLLEGVTLVISGIANPDRGNLRSMAISMGAKYRADWDHSCTHLICAFLNTPKYNQVKGKGKIVKRNWIEECHTQRKRLPWRRFALDNNEQRQVESEDEIIEETVNVAANDENTLNIDEDDPEHVEEASDTEERLLEVTQPSTSKAGTNLDFEDIYSVDTDIEEDIGDSPNSAYTPLKSIFENKKFYVDNSFEEGVLTKLNKYIMAYKGKIILDPSEKPDIIIATEENSQNLKNEYPVFHCVNPNWIWYCHNNQKCMSMEQFLY